MHERVSVPRRGRARGAGTTPLDVNRLRVLVAVARHGSVTAAARALRYAQPSVSHHLARLEAETGSRLVQRAGRGIRLTDAGGVLGGPAGGMPGRAGGGGLVQRAGRGIRLTDAGRLLADRAEEILGRLDAAEAELAAHEGLRSG